MVILSSRMTQLSDVPFEYLQANFAHGFVVGLTYLVIFGPIDSQRSVSLTLNCQLSVEAVWYPDDDDRDQRSR